MKVDTTKLKRGSSELTPECRQLIEQISRCRNRAEILQFLETVNVWVYGKCELYHWIEILDRFDKVLEEAARQVDGNEFMLHCDTTFSAEDTRLLLLMLNFTTLLIEHSFSRHLYNSIEHLTQLLSSQNMDIVLAVLNLLYMFSKRSNFIPRLSFEKKEMLLTKLFNIAERWGDPNYGLALVDCCIRKPKLEFLYQLSIEYTDEVGQAAFLEIPDMMDICNSAPPAEVINVFCKSMLNPSDAIKMRIAHRVRLVSGFKDYKLRLQFVQARLQAISVLIYSNALQENIEKILYPGFGEELCELIDKEDVHLVEIRAAVLRTLTSMLHFDRNPNVPRPGSRLAKIIQYTGAERQGGILPLLVRDCIASLTGDSPCEKYPLVLATSLFSLLYHLASYEAGGQALIKSGMMQSLLRVISWPGVDLEHITFVTRAVRVIDLITSIDIAKFHQNNGLNVFIDRLEKEVNSCREALVDVENTNKTGAEGNVTVSSRDGSLAEGNESVEAMIDDPTPLLDGDTDHRNTFESDVILLQDSTSNTCSNTDVHHFERNMDSVDLDSDSSRFVAVERAEPVRYPANSYYARPLNERNVDYTSVAASQTKKLTCVTQRAALLKSMLNFLKKSIQDHAHFNGMRNIMETSLPSSLRHIISNAEYYGPSLFLLATDVVTVYVFNEPSLLSSLQDSGITNVMLQSLLQKDVPATREVLGSLPNVFSAMCLNERGLMEFMSYEPFDKLLKVLLSPDYLVAMRRRRSSDPLGDTATNLGNAMDDLMKHHPYLRTDATEAIVRLLNELVRLGSDSNFICWRANKDNNGAVAANASAANSANQSNQSFVSANVSNEMGSNENENDSSGEDDDDDDEMSSASQQQQRQNRSAVEHQQMQARANQQEREAIPLIDYILNVMKFIDAIFSNSGNGEHCREFVMHGGLKPLLQLLSLPNLPVDSPVSTTAQAVANVCKSILNLAHETKVIDTALQQLSQIIDNLKPLIKHFNFPGGSVLLRELLSCPKLDDGFSIADYTPLLHSMSSVHGYVVLLVHLCRNASNEMRSILLKRWGTNSSTGLQLLQSLVRLYISLVWESTILLSLCSDEPYVQNADFGWYETAAAPLNISEGGDEKAFDRDETARKTDRACASRVKLKPEEQLRYIKSLLAASSRLGRALAELFGTLVKLSVGTPQSRQRRNNEYVTSISSSKFPTADAKEIARVLSSILVNGFSHEDIVSKPAPKLKLTFLICSVGFTGPMLFDDKRSSFHLMISQFCEENGLKAFFEMFYWALSLDGSPVTFSFERCLKMEDALENSDTDANDYPEGTGEFLDAWLQLLEKMVNPRAILDSPYAISPRVAHMPEIVHFEPIFYLIQLHQLALQTIRRIWKRKPINNYGVSMTETIMAILKHLIKSRNMLGDRYKARLDEIENATKMLEQCKKPARPPDEANINAGHFKVLTDMGFVRQHVLEALRNTRSLEQATDYLLNHTETSAATLPSSENSTLDSAARSSTSTEMEVDLDSSVAASTSSGSIPGEKPLKLLPSGVFDAFCEETLERTFTFMEYLPETVNTGTELISALYHRDNQWDRLVTFVANLVKSITDCTDNILNGLKQPDIVKSNELEEYLSGALATKLLIRLKVSTLLLDEMYSDIRKEFCAVISQDQHLNSFIELLNRAETLLEEQVALSMKPVTPRWLQNLIEFIDAIDNVSVILQRRENMRAVCNENWKWYDASTGKWNSYTESNNLLIRNAFNMGERSVVISIGRQRYTINFNCMTQVSEASGSHRPVLPALKLVDAIGMLSNSNANAKVENILTRTIRSKGDGNNVTQQDEVICLRTLMNFSDDACGAEEQESEEVKAENAKKREGGTAKAASTQPEATDPDPTATANNLKKLKSKVTARLNVKKTPTTLKRVQKIVLHEEPVGFSNTSEIISCLVRLLQPTLMLNLETKLSILKLCARLTKDYENAKVFHKNDGIKLLLNMRQTCGLMGFPTYAIVIIRHVLEAPPVLQESIEKILATRASQTVPAGHRDLIFVLTQVSSAVARHPQIFLAAAKQTLRADYMTNSTFSIDDSRLVVKSQVSANHKCVSTPPHLLSKSEENAESIRTSEQVVEEMLRAIVQPCSHYGGIRTEEDQFEYAQDAQEFSAVPSESSPSKISNPKKNAESFEPCCCSWHIPSSSHMHQKPVLPRSTLLKTLADAVRSYQSLVPRIIIEHVYTPADSALIEKEQSCLSFILDNFLPIIRRQQDSEVSMMSRVLISSLSDCFSQPAVQTKVVEEIHDAIVRVLTKHNPTEKHTRLQVLIGLLPVMIESPMLSNKIHVQRNNMYRILLRQGIMTDLAKIAQYKDLSNSNTLTTIYSILRPMEILLRLTIAPGSLSSRRIFFGTAPQGASSIVNRRFYPRLASRATSGGGSSVGGEHVLRDIIRNVLSDRRHAFDFILNGDDIFLDSEDAAAANTASADDEIEDNDGESNAIPASSNVRPQLNFDRLWDDLLQNESLRLINRAANMSRSGAGNNGGNTGEHHRHRNNDDGGNADNGVGGGSDGASTSSEIVAAVVDNATSLLGDVSTSESDSDSNVSTENDRNDDEEDEDDDDEDGNEEAIEDRSETDADEETRQFIEVFDHIYEPESSETASNDADVDADDEASEVGGGRGGGINTSQDVSNVTESRETSSSETHIPSEGEHNEQSGRGNAASDAPEVDAALSSETVNNTLTQTFANDGASNDPRNSVRTTPASEWVTPRVALTRNDSIYRTSIDLGMTNTITISNERNDSRAATGTPTVYMNSTASNSLPIGAGVQRRESTRRLVFLDQQYCVPMPSFTNPTEEGQLELFNQDALHWWLEEAKHLDLESQTDACLYVAHLLIPFLIKELKTARSQKKTESANPIGNFATSSNRRSAIPVLIQQSISSTVGAPNNTAAVNAVTNTRNVDTTTSTNQDTEPSQFRVPQLLSTSGSASLSHRFEQQQRQTGNQNSSLGEVECSSEDENPGVSDTNDDEADDDDEDDYEDEEDLDDDDDEDELNTTFLEEDELNTTFNIDFENDVQGGLTESNATADAENLVRETSTDLPVSVDFAENFPISLPTGEQVFVGGASPSASATAIATSTPTTETTNAAPPAENTANVTAVAVEPQPPADAAESDVAEAAPAPRVTPPANQTMSPEVRAALGDLEVPEGVDPSFLAALPSEMREEVITEHLRMQRIRQRAQQNAIQVAHDSLVEVNPEFLAALPPNIQSEVLMQQRIEQQRQAAQTANPDEPVDTAAFFQNLPESLRQTILTDMEESQIASLPPDLAAEAQYLRRDWESRNGSRLDAAQSNPLNGYLTGRFPSSLQNLSDESRWNTNSIWYDSIGTPQSQHHQHTTIVHHHQQQLHGKPIALLLMEDENNLLDPDSLATLLLFLFIEDSKINYTRFHRVIRNLCYHLPTREWIINALISIIQKTNEGKIKQTGQKIIKPQWLKLRVDAAFGYKSNVFIINRFKGVGSNANTSTDCSISINPQAAQMIVRNCLDMLFVLAKHFPRSFVPFNRENKKKFLDLNETPATSTETIASAPLSVAINSGGPSATTAATTAATAAAAAAAATENEMSSEELRAIFQRNHTPNTPQRLQTSLKQSEAKGYDSRLDDSPSTSKAAAIRNQQKSNLSAAKSKQMKGVLYNTNAKQFWDVLLNIDLHTHQRFVNLQAFPINSHPKWEWEEQTPEFQTFNDSPFAKLLEMLPYKVICRSPQLTDMLVKLLASLSNDLPKEEESVEPAADEKAYMEDDKTKPANSTAGSSEAKLKDGKDGDSSSDDEDKLNPQSSAVVKMKRKLYSKNFSQLQLIIEVLTHQCGTADGLENISKLIVNLSQCSHASNAIFLQYLTSAILGLAQEVRQAVQNLLDEIRAYKLVHNEKFGATSKGSYQASVNPSIHQGIMQDRFTAENVVISAPTNIKPSCELQLPAMKKLLSPSSAQPYFLRTLKIFMQVRELFEAQENAAGSNLPNKKPTLSQIICLDDLWNTLSECLVALEESKDEYAVLVLQPTVEAFFLIHASYRKNTNKAETNAPNKRGNRDNAADDESNVNASINTNASAAGIGADDTGGTDATRGTDAAQPPAEAVPSTSTRPQPNQPAKCTPTNSREIQQNLDRQKFLLFAEKHRTVLNQILRQSSVHLSDGPFAVLVDHTRILDFDVKRKYFQTELERIDEGVRREENTVSVRRVTVFEDSFRVLYRLGPEEWKNRFYIVFEDEEGQDAGGLLREWYVIISREIFNPMYALFCVSPGDRVTYMINPSSHANPNHLSYFKFVGRVIAKAVHDNKLLECYFTRSFYKHILGKQVKYTDMESQDYEFYKGLDYLMKNDISTLGYELTFSTEVQEFGVTQVRDLIPNGRDIAVNEENKFDYVQLVCQLKMSGSIRQQLDAFLEGFYDIIPKHLISIFNEQELELLISGLPDIDIEDLKANTEYHKYTSKSIQIQWFWRALRSFDQADRAKFLQFVTGTSKVPLQGFGSLEGMNGIQKFQIHRDDRSTDRLPCAHTCFNQLDLPMYKSYEKLRSCLLKAIHECSEGFGFA